MLSSKANAALARLKEIEEKYKMKRKEQKRKEDTDSSISSVSIVPSEKEFLAETKESPRKSTKPKLDIKMPNTRFEGHIEEMKLSPKSERSTPNKADAKPPEDVAEIDLDVAMPLDDKSSRSTGKQESLISDIMTIQENSLIESVLDDSMPPSKSLSRSKTLRRNSFTASDRFSGREDRTRAAARSEGGRESDKSSEISRGKAPSDNSLIAKRLRLSEKSNEKISKRPGLRKHSIEAKANTETSKEADSKIQGDSNGLRSLRDIDTSVVEESIGTMEDDSEIISELSRAEESFVAKIEDSEDSKHLIDKNTSIVVSNSSKDLMAENGYANDTFEDDTISSSTIRSQREEMINGNKEVVDEAGSSTKKIDIVEYRSYQDSAEEHRDGLVIALNLTPKSSATKVDLEPSNYVSDLESIIAHPDNVTVRSIKLPQSAGLRSKTQRRRYQHREASFRDKNILSAVRSNKNTSDSSESSTGDVTKTDEKKNSLGMTTVRQESGRKERGETSTRAKEHAMIDVTGLPVANDDWIESAKSNSSLKKNEEEGEDVFEESLDQRISQDAEYVLRKSHKDTINVFAKRHASSKTMTKASESFSDSKTKVRNAPKTKKVTVREENENYRCSEKNKMCNHNCREYNTKKKKKGARMTNSKSAGTRNSMGSRKEDKTSLRKTRIDGKQTRGLRKRIVELRLQQEREDLQKYLHELKDLRLESGSTPSYFRPLEFPKIAEFTQPDDLESKPDDRLRERVLSIRRWLKDQYVLYRDYCTMAQAINAHYVPTTLDDAKKTIRKLRKMTIKTR